MITIYSIARLWNEDAQKGDVNFSAALAPANPAPPHQAEEGRLGVRGSGQGSRGGPRRRPTALRSSCRMGL